MITQIILFLVGTAIGIIAHRRYLKTQNTFDTTDAMVYAEAITDIEEKWLDEQLGPYCYACRRPFWDSTIENSPRTGNPVANKTN